MPARADALQPVVRQVFEALRAGDPALAEIPPLQSWGTVDNEDRELARAAGTGLTPLKLAASVIGVALILYLVLAGK